MYRARLMPHLVPVTLCRTFDELHLRNHLEARHHNRKHSALSCEHLDEECLLQAFGYLTVGQVEDPGYTMCAKCASG
jgi:hypothetical protein